MILAMEDIDELAGQIITDLRPVHNAISDIEEVVGALITTDEYTEQVQEEIKQIVAYLTELQTEHVRLRDELEARTITVSAKRHALKTKTEEFRKEKKDSILAARNHWAVMMKSLQSRLEIASVNSENVDERVKVLKAENANLMPKQTTVKKQYNHLVIALNEKLSTRASEHIKVNETLKQARKTSLLAQEYGVGVQNLLEDMERFHANHGFKHQQVEDEVAKIKEAIKLQDEANEHVKKPGDELQAKIDVMEKKLEAARGKISEREESKAKLSALGDQLEAGINRERLLNEQTEEEVTILKSSMDRQKMEYGEKINELEVKIKQVDAQFGSVEEEHAAIKEEKKIVCLEEDTARREKLRAQASVHDIIKKVKQVKQETTLNLEKTALVTQENTITRQKLLTHRENHTATVEMFNHQILDYKMNLNKARTDKIKAKEEEEQTEKTLDNFNIEQIRFVKEMNKKIEDGQNLYKKLLCQCGKLEDGVEENITRGGKLRKELKVAESRLRVMRREFSTAIAKLETSTELYTAENEKKERFVKDKSCKVKEMEAGLEQDEQEYSQLKDQVITIRNKEKGLVDQIKQKQLMVEKLAEPHDKLKNDIDSRHMAGRDQLKQTAMESQILEGDIYDRTQKYENTWEENEKFEESCIERADTIREIRMDIRAHGRHQESLAKELQELQGKFMASWDVCVKIEMEATEQDTQILNGIRELQQETKERHLALTDLSGQLNSEMERLTSFLENEPTSESKRKETRSSLKPTKQDFTMIDKRISLKSTPSTIMKKSRKISGLQAQRKFTLPANNTIPSAIPFYLRTQRKLTLPAIPSPYGPQVRRKYTLAPS